MDLGADQILALLKRGWEDPVQLQRLQETIESSSNQDIRFYLGQVRQRLQYIGGGGQLRSETEAGSSREENRAPLMVGGTELRGMAVESAPHARSSPTAREAPQPVKTPGATRATQAIDGSGGTVMGAHEASDGKGIVWRPLHIPSFQASDSSEEYELHLAAVEWGLDPAILIQSAEDIQSRRHWSEIFEPFEHQVRNLITFCRRAPVALIADDVGLGKTISAGLIISELMARGKVRRVLVLAPTLLLPQWKEELRKNFQIESDHGVGTDLTQLATNDVPVVVTTYASARNRISALASSGFDMLIMDEAHKLRNLFPPTGAPQIAIRIREALAARSFRYVLMLTATPIHNRLWDIYSLVDLLAAAKGHQNPLGSASDFSRRFMADSGQVGRQLHPGRRDEFRRHLSQYMVRTRRADCDLPFPERHIRTIRAEGNLAEKDLIALVARDIKDLNPLAQVSLAQALMSSPQALLEQLERTGRRAPLAEAQRIAARIGRTGKEQVLTELVEQLQKDRPKDWRVVIFTGRIATQEAIGALLRARFGERVVGFIRGNRPDANQRTIEEYFKDSPNLHVIVSTDAGAEGVNLQAGNVVVNYDLPWNPMILEQRIGRVQRLASRHAKVSVLNLVLAGSVEERIVGRITEKLSTIAATLGDIEGILESLGEDEESLEREIKRMVLASLEGQDVEASLQRIQASVDRAKSIYEEEKRSVEDSLGRLDAMHHDGPRMPKLSEVEPRLPEERFTLDALRREGGELQEKGNGSYVHSRPGRATELVVFDESQRPSETAFFGGPAVHLFRSGQPAFERLVGRWVARSRLNLADAGQGNDADRAVRACVDLWAEKYEELQVVSLQSTPRRWTFHGSVAVRVACSVAHDKYEKLVEIPIEYEASQPHEPQAEAGASGELHRSATILARDLGGKIQSALATDADVVAFGRFYLERMKEEVGRSGGDGRLAELARTSFQPEVAAEVVGLAGTRQWTTDVEVRYTIDGRGPYASRLQCDPCGGVTVEVPEEAACEVSGRCFPIDALLQCSVTGKNVLAHILERSEKSGRLALAEHMVMCAVTGRRLLSEEVGMCHVRRVLVDRDMLEPSMVSGKTALREEMKECSFTGAKVLPDELDISEVSARPYRKDERRDGEGRTVRGHTSEFVRCQATGAWLLADELAISDVTKKAARRDLLKASAKSGRLGLLSEGGNCAATGRFLLNDEMGMCAVSNQVVDKDLLIASDASGRLGLGAHVLVCQQSGARLLEDEVGKCCLTGRVVDVRLLEASEYSGLLALRDMLVPCGETGKRVLPHELGACEVTGLKVIAERLHACAVTGRRACERVLVKSAVSRKWLLRDEAVNSKDGNAHCLPAEAVRCAWDQAFYFPRDVGICAWTRVRIAFEYRDPSGVLRPLKSLLQREDAGEIAPPGVVEYVKKSLGLRKIEDVRSRTGPGGRCVAVVATLTGFLGFNARQVGMVVRLGASLEREGVEVVGRMRGQVWTPDPQR